MNIGIWYSGNRDFFLDDVGVTVPSNIFWGLNELRADGHCIIELNKAPEGSASLPGARDLTRLFAARQDLNNCDVVIFYGVQRAALAAALQRLGVIKARIFLYIFGQNLFEMSASAKSIMSMRLQLIGRRNRLGVVSAYERTKINQILRVDAENYDVIHHGIDTFFYRPAPKRVGSMISVGNNAGRDWEMLVKAVTQGKFSIKILSHRFPGKIGIPATCKLMANLDFSASRDLMASSDIAIFPTRSNTCFSTVNSLMAGLACGSVVVATDDPLCREYGLVHNHNAILIPEGDPTTLVSEVRRVLADPDLKRSLQIQARHQAERHNMRVMADSLHDSLKRLIL